MSFWGLILKPGQKHPVESAAGDILHLSQACLHQPKGGKNYLQVTDNEKTYAIACLEKDKVEHASFDLFFSTGSCIFSCKGDTEVHLTGYFEPEQDMGDESGESEDEVAVPVKKSPLQKPGSPAAAPAKSPLMQAKANAMKNVKEDDEDEDEEEEESMGEGEEEEEEESDEEPPKKAAQQNDKKRKAEDSPAGGPAKKAATGGNASVDAFVKQIQECLKKNGGKSKISFLGSKVQRPKDAPKLKAVIEQHKDKFVLSGDDVELKK